MSYSRTKETQYRSPSGLSETADRCTINDNPESSSVMSEILSSDHVNNEELHLYRQRTFIYECGVKHVHKMGTYLTGSRIECSVSQGSDEDQMIQVRDTEVVTDGSCDVSLAENVITMNTKECPPGFALLSPYRLSQNLIRHETQSCLESCFQIKGVIYLSSDIYLKYFIDMITGMDEFSPPSFHAGESLRHGPCVMLNYSKYGQDSDMGIGLKCSVWPEESLEWISRKRKSNWPDELLINKIKSMPCHILPVGHPFSTRCHLEWRFAFVLPERELIWNFKDVQIQCYVIFKSLKKDILDKVAPEEINSFHLKTIVFWLSEEIIHWDPSDLVDCVKLCLSFLKKCIQQKHLSHYFLRSRNLFEVKLEDEKARIRLTAEIERIQKNVLGCFMNCKWYCKREYRLLTLRKLLHDLPRVNFLAAGRTVLQNNIRIFQRNKHTHARCLSFEVTLSVMFLPTDVESLLSIAEEVSDHLGETLMGIYALKFLSIRVGILYLLEAKRTPEKQMRQTLISESKWCFEAGIEHDVLAASMYLLTYYYQARNYSVIRKFLSKLFSRRRAIPYKGIPGHVICGERSLLSPDMDETVTENDMANENDVAFDVVFSFSDIDCVPPALQYELALLDGRSNWYFCAINPLVYVSYIQFQVAVNLGDKEQLPQAVEHLRSMVGYVENGQGCSNGRPVELHRHYNLLGYCYYITKDARNAITWFVKSLEACPTSGNAAAYHLCNAVYACNLF